MNAAAKQFRTAIEKTGLRPPTEKRFLPGGRTSGCDLSIGAPHTIADGHATGTSIDEATSHAVTVAVNAGNLLPVAQTLRAWFPQLRLAVRADDDAGTRGNPGLVKARGTAYTERLASGIAARGGE
jgi:putative DNA primase/helicase